MKQLIEINYPLGFRQQDAASLGTNLRQHNSVILIGMKRVGISNFLRFFLEHKEASKHYIQKGKLQFVVVDLNDLVERTLFAFWMLTLKRVADEIAQGKYPETIKQEAKSLFTESIQLRDLFFTIEAVQRLLSLMVEQGAYVCLFLSRFDRLAENITPEFFANLQGLKDRVAKLSYVMTSFRPLHELVPTVFTRSSLVLFLHEQYLLPAKDSDLQTMMLGLSKRYDLKLNDKVIKEVLRLSGGHAQYMQLALLRLKHEHALLKTPERLEKVLLEDEEIRFLGEELFSNLTKEEQLSLQNALNSHEQPTKYLLDTGMLVKVGKAWQCFSPLFASFIALQQKTENGSNEFTKKEHALYAALRANEGKILEREKIIEAVWPDAVEFGVSDWALDRLVGRLRRKLKLQNSPYRVVTVITRGYKLIVP